MTQFNPPKEKLNPGIKNPEVNRDNYSDQKDTDLNRPYGDAEPTDVEKQRSDDLSRRRQSST